MNEREKNKNLNRRRQADWVVKSAAALSVVAWVMAFFVMLLIDVASPDRTDFFTNFFGGADIRMHWEARFLWLGFILLILSFLCCVFAFIFNMMRMRRKTDKIRKSVLIMGIMSFIAIIIYLLRFIILI